MGVIGGACLALIALFLPPLAPLFRTGCSIHFFISILLTILGWIPGVLYAWYIIIAYPSGTYGSRSRGNEKYQSSGHHHHRSHSRSGRGHNSRHEYDDYPAPAQGYYQQPAYAPRQPTYGGSGRRYDLY